MSFMQEKSSYLLPKLILNFYESFVRTWVLISKNTQPPTNHMIFYDTQKRKSLKFFWKTALIPRFTVNKVVTFDLFLNMTFLKTRSSLKSCRLGWKKPYDSRRVKEQIKNDRRMNSAVDRSTNRKIL